MNRHTFISKSDVGLEYLAGFDIDAISKNKRTGQQEQIYILMQWYGITKMVILM